MFVKHRKMLRFFNFHEHMFLENRNSKYNALFTEFK